jgi:hypothetical protein
MAKPYGAFSLPRLEAVLLAALDGLGSVLS